MKVLFQRISVLTYLLLLNSCGKTTSETTPSAVNGARPGLNSNTDQEMYVTQMYGTQMPPNVKVAGTVVNSAVKEPTTQPTAKNVPAKDDIQNALEKCLAVTASFPYQNEYDYHNGMNIIRHGPPILGFIPNIQICKSMPKDDVFNCRDFSKALIVCMEKLGLGGQVQPMTMGCFNDKSETTNGAENGHRINMVKKDDGQYCPIEPQGSYLNQPYSKCCSSNKAEAAVCANKLHCERYGQQPFRRGGYPSFPSNEEAKEEKCYLWNEKENCYNVKVPIIGTETGIPPEKLPRATNINPPSPIPVAPFPTNPPDCLKAGGAYRKHLNGNCVLIIK